MALSGLRSQTITCPSRPGPAPSPKSRDARSSANTLSMAAVIVSYFSAMPCTVSRVRIGLFRMTVSRGLRMLFPYVATLTSLTCFG
jgi:hypothetical protein